MLALLVTFRPANPTSLLLPLSAVSLLLPLLAPTAALGRVALVHVQTVSPCGVYKLRLCKNGQWQTVTVDDYFPCWPGGGPAYSRSHGNELWVRYPVSCCLHRMRRGQTRCLRSAQARPDLFTLSPRLRSLDGGRDGRYCCWKRPTPSSTGPTAPSKWDGRTRPCSTCRAAPMPPFAWRTPTCRSAFAPVPCGMSSSGVPHACAEQGKGGGRLRVSACLAACGLQRRGAGGGGRACVLPPHPLMARRVRRWDEEGYVMSCSTPGEDVYTETGEKPEKSG